MSGRIWPVALVALAVEPALGQEPPTTSPLMFSTRAQATTTLTFSFASIGPDGEVKVDWALAKIAAEADPPIAIATRIAQLILAVRDGKAKPMKPENTP